MHRVVHAPGGIHDELRRLAHALIVAVGALQDRQADTLDRGDRLPELVVQLAGNAAPLLLDMGLDHLCQFAILLQPLARLAGKLLGRGAVRDRLRGAVEGGAHEPALPAGQARQPRLVVALLHALQSLDHGLQRLEHAPGEPEYRGIDDRQRDRADPQQPAQGVPAVEHRTRGIGLHHQPSVADADLLALRQRRHQAGEPARRVAAALVRGRRRCIHQRARRIVEKHVVGSHAAELVEEASACRAGRIRRRPRRRA